MEITHLVYMERARFEDAEQVINGPELYKTEEEAIGALYNYVSEKIRNGLLDVFDACCKEIGMDFEDYLTSEDNVFDEVSFKKIESSLGIEEKQKVCDWYFKFKNDDGTEAFYRVGTSTIV